MSGVAPVLPAGHALAIGGNGQVHGSADDWPRHVLPTKWYESRPSLALVRRWGMARLVPPDALLAHVLVTQTLAVPTAVALPGLIGAPTAANLGAVVVADTGIGKTAARSLAGEATTAVPRRLAVLGTAEGLAEALLDAETREPHDEPVLVTCDEGTTLERLLARQGESLDAALCTAISGGELGKFTADRKRRRTVAALTYPLGVALSVQPVFLRGVLADMDGGLPQRFLYLAGTGHHLAEPPDDPTERVHVRVPEWERYPRDSFGRRLVPVPEAIATEIREAHLARIHAADRGEPVAAGSHRMLLRLRLA